MDRREFDLFAEDVKRLSQSDEPIPFQLTEQAMAAIRASVRRPAKRRCASRMPYVTIHGGQSW